MSHVTRDVGVNTVRAAQWLLLQ